MGNGSDVSARGDRYELALAERGVQYLFVRVPGTRAAATLDHADIVAGHPEVRVCDVVVVLTGVGLEQIVVRVHDDAQQVIAVRIAGEVDELPGGLPHVDVLPARGDALVEPPAAVGLRRRLAVVLGIRIDLALRERVPVEDLDVPQAKALLEYRAGTHELAWSEHAVDVELGDPEHVVVGVDVVEDERARVAAVVAS